MITKSVHYRDGVDRNLARDRAHIDVGRRSGPSPRTRARAALLGAPLLALLIGCEPSPFEPAVSTTIGVPPPPELTARSVDRGRLRLDARVNGDPVDTVDRGEFWELTARVPPASESEFELEWRYENVFEDSDVTLLLARLPPRAVRVGSSDVSIPVDFEEFDTGGGEDGDELDRDFDRDKDGATNYEEVRRGFDPTNRNLCPDCRTDVDLTIPRVNEAAVVDGRYLQPDGGDAWAEGQFKDRDGVMWVDTPLSGQGEEDGSRSQWGAMHDGRDLILFVFGEGEPKTSSADSALSREDDSFELHVESVRRVLRLVVPVRDSSRNRNVDARGEIRLLGSDDDIGGWEAADASEAVAFGQAVGDGEVSVATCTCEGERDFYEIRVSLAYLGAVPGEDIGIEVQLNDDDDGGGVDRRWGWRSPQGSGRSTQAGLGLTGRAALEE